MRKTHILQRSIFEFYCEHESGQQLKAISAKLDEHPKILDLASEALIPPGTKSTGRCGLSVDSIVRAALLKQMMGLTYNDLSFYLADSHSYRSFSRVENEPSSSSLQACISKLDDNTWEKINHLLLADAAQTGIEKGRMVRIDSTVTETNIHPPTDSSLLWDCVRVMVSQLTRVKGLLIPGRFDFCNHCRAAKKRMRNITYARGANKTRLYKELLQYTKQTKTYLALAMSLTEHVQDAMVFPMLQLEAESLIRLTDKVISQTERRVLQGEKVPSEEKVFSIFETHTDIIIKGARDIQYGHKLNLTTGKSGLVLDVFIEQGNPADTARLCPMIDRQQEIYGRVPRQVAVDGGYASTGNLEKVKAMGVKDAAFHKKRGLKIEDMVKSDWVYKKLRNFRAGVEGNISCLKRRYGLSRCTWRGLEKFKAYIWSSTVAYNLMLLARLESPG